MKIEFILSETDLLTHQLFAASKSKRVQKRRAKGKLFLLLIYMAVGLFIWQRNGVVTGGIFFLVCLPLYLLYIYMERKQYVTHFKTYVKDVYKDRSLTTTTIDIEDKLITMTDGTNESTVPMVEVEVIYEIGSLYSLGLSTGQSIVIPKANVTPADNLAPYFREVAGRFDIPYEQELNWKWK
jgi:Ca2+/Na+ antiporter